MSNYEYSVVLIAGTDWHGLRVETVADASHRHQLGTREKRGGGGCALASRDSVLLSRVSCWTPAPSVIGCTMEL